MRQLKIVTVCLAGLALIGCKATKTPVSVAPTASVVQAEKKETDELKNRATLMPEEVAKRIIQKYSFATPNKRQINAAMSNWVEAPYFQLVTANGRACSRVNGRIADIDGVTLFKTARPVVGYTAVVASRHAGHLKNIPCEAGVVFSAHTEEEAGELFSALKALGAPVQDFKIVSQ